MKTNFLVLLGVLIILVGLYGPWTPVESFSNVSQLEVTLTGISDNKMYLDAFGVLFVLVIVSLIGSFFLSRWIFVALTGIGLLGAFLALLAYKDFLGIDAVADAPASWGFWLTLFGFLWITVASMSKLATLQAIRPDERVTYWLRNILPPAVVPLLVMLVWEAGVEGLRVQMAFLPRVSDIYIVFVRDFSHLSFSLNLSEKCALFTGSQLLDSSLCTLYKKVLPGYVLGSLAGLGIGFLVSLSLFVRRGFLPLATAFSTIPIVGLAPVLGRALGIDEESKIAVAIIVSFFPVLINVVQGLITIDPLKLDLMQSYAARNRHILFKLRFWNALPYVFNALKIASIIVLISVIVAEFLIPSSPQVLGQRISITARNGQRDVTFAFIVVASVMGIVFYNVIALIERFFTSWHSSFREKEL